MRLTIENVPHSSCTGCGACLNKCPQNAIIMEYDAEGFLFPTVTKACVECGACLKTCPAENPVQLHEASKSYAVWAQNDIRMKSSSGGMFSLMANEILDRGGAVCGAAYADDFRTVHHIWAQSKEELAPLRGSKYVQSDTKLSYRQAKAFLDAGRLVLYTGCPCQVAGLYRYLGKHYDNLFTADLVCHGSNSVTAYQSYLDEFCGNQELERFDFRDKSFYGWSTSVSAYFKDGTVKKSPFNEADWYKGFLQGIINRPNCYHCSYARAERVADITMADCWQISRLDPAMDDRKGTSLVLVNSDQGEKLFDMAKKSMKLCREVPLEEVRKYNGQLNWPTPAHPFRKFFFEHLQQDGYHKSLLYGSGMRFDIGVVGWWFASNYGSCLTYYALGNFLAEMGKQIILVKLPNMVDATWDADTQISIEFLSKYFKTSAERNLYQLSELNQFCDSFMLGSDQMWRVESISLVGYSFFLDFADNSKKKIAFSTSFGNEQFTENQEIRRVVSDLLGRFDAISVREKSGIEVCEREFGLKAQQLLDPIFFCGREAYDHLAEGINNDGQKGYLLCYILDPSPEKEQTALEIAKHEGLEILTILGMKEYSGAIKHWTTGNVLPKVTPEQFVYYVKNCDYLLTDSHHGTCFGIIYHKRYVAFVNEERGATRFETVAEATGLQSRLIKNVNELQVRADLYDPIDYDSVETKLVAEKERAVQWLKSAFAMPHEDMPDTLTTVKLDAQRRDMRLQVEVQQLRNMQAAQTLQIQQLQEQIHKIQHSVAFGEKTKNKPKEYYTIFRRSLKEHGWKYTLSRVWRFIKK